MSNVFRILLATDTHVGFKERDPLRGDDSFVTFEEILNIAKQEKVDMIFHGGDLYDENEPSRETQHRMMNMLKKYCIGDGAVDFDCLSDRKLLRGGSLNYESPNLNINLPIFMIHGNHDDPNGAGGLSALDILQQAGLINYFGAAPNVDAIDISPIMLKKGNTNVALYGLGNIRDERLNRTFANNKVNFLVPDSLEEWFSILLVHQNRFKGNFGSTFHKSSLQDNCFPSFMDFVLWGHEHDSHPELCESAQFPYKILQLGSSVRTSLSQGETLPKHVALLEICEKEFRYTPIPLQTVRRMYFEDIMLSSLGISPDDSMELHMTLSKKVHEIAEEHRRNLEEEHKAHKETIPPWYYELHAGKEEKTTPLLSSQGIQYITPCIPLIRLRLNLTGGFTPISNGQFGREFQDIVCNPNDILLFVKKTVKSQAMQNIPIIELQSEEILLDANIDVSRINEEVFDLLYIYMKNNNNALSILLESDMNESIQDYIYKSDAHAIERYVENNAAYHLKRLKTIFKDMKEFNAEAVQKSIKDHTEERRQELLRQINSGNENIEEIAKGDEKSKGVEINKSKEKSKKILDNFFSEEEEAKDVQPSVKKEAEEFLQIEEKSSHPSSMSKLKKNTLSNLDFFSKSSFGEEQTISKKQNLQATRQNRTSDFEDEEDVNASFSLSFVKQETTKKASAPVPKKRNLVVVEKEKVKLESSPTKKRPKAKNNAAGKKKNDLGNIGSFFDQVVERNRYRPTQESQAIPEAPSKKSNAVDVFDLDEFDPWQDSPIPSMTPSGVKPRFLDRK